MIFNHVQAANLAYQGDRDNRASAPGGAGGLQMTAPSHGKHRPRKGNPAPLTLTTAV